MDKAQLVDGLDGENDLCNVEASDVLGKDLILNEHSHEIASWQELHQHVQEVLVLEGGVELDDPWAVRLGQNVTLSTNVGELILLEHLTLDQRLHGVDLAISSLLNQLNLTKSTLANDFESVVVLGLVLGPKESQVLTLLLSRVGPGLLSARLGLVRIHQALLHLTLPGDG